MVMWPRLVANKLLQRPPGSNSFVADMQSTIKVLPEFKSSDEGIFTNKPFNDSEDTLKYKLFASTWNVGGMLPLDDVNLEDWLDTKNNSYDIYVLGFQEIVPLSAKNILGPEKSKITMKWNSLIRATLNKSLSNLNRCQEFKVGEKQVYPIKDGISKGSIVQDFRCIVSKKMVGILISVWVRGDLHGYVRHTSVSCIGCGLLGWLGNKGSVAVRFFLHETSFCFVCCHLASGGKEGDEVHRNADAMEIFFRTVFPRGPLLNLPQNISDHDRVILLGDLNYRISLPETKTLSLVEEKEWSELLQNDQLRSKLSNGRVFEEWQEGMITFSPTYKYYPNSDEYYGCRQDTKGEKKRAPAWCDRILWRGKGMKQHQYDRSELRLSDHRPVRSVFTVEIEVARNPSSSRSFFVSDRLDYVTNNIDICPNVEPRNGRSSLYV